MIMDESSLISESTEVPQIYITSVPDEPFRLRLHVAGRFKMLLFSLTLLIDTVGSLSPNSICTDTSQPSLFMMTPAPKV